jgi:psiF repeat
MKLLSALTLTALLSASAAFAADAPAAGTAAPAGAPTAKHMSLKACNKQADEKKLTGADRSAFVKDCHGAKKS